MRIRKIKFHLIVLLHIFAFFPLSSYSQPVIFDGGAAGINIGVKNRQLSNRLGPNCQELVMSGYCFTNTLRSEVVKYYIHPGGERNTPDEIEIVYFTNSDFPILSSKRNVFVTNKGIQLGMVKEDLVRILGKPTAEKIDFIGYKNSVSEFTMENYNLPGYFSNYYFKNGKLVKFRFGFINP